MRGQQAWRVFPDIVWQALAEVPAAGESVALSELGTHCLGAWFLDGGAQVGVTNVTPR
jgi:hypothetical protein